MAALSPTEIATGLITGGTQSTPPRAPTATEGPVEALERALLPALLSPRCLVSFSGGLDSSLVLAVADRLALREGLARPVPVTFRFPDAPQAREDDAQEAVVAALGCPDWQRIEVVDEAHMLGPWAARAVRLHGVLHPANAFLHLPLLDLASGGTLLTGIGGDQVLGGWRTPPRVRRPWWWPGRGAVGGQRAPDFGWLRPVVAHRSRRRLAVERASQPRRFGDRVAWHAGRRDLAVSLRTMELLAEATGARTVSPLTDAGFCAALAARGGASGFSPSGVVGRSATVRAWCGDLPEAVTAPRRKATFTEVFWRRPTLELLRAWDGTGVDERLVDVEGLRAEWAKPRPAALTGKLVHQIWLASPERVPTPDPRTQESA